MLTLGKSSTFAGFLALVLAAACGGSNVVPPEPPKPPPPGPAVAPTPPPAPAANTTSSTPYSGHGLASVPPEMIAQFSPKALPGEVTRRIQSMLDIRAPGGAQVSPDGKSMFFNWSVTGVYQVWKLDGPRRFPVQLTGGEDVTKLIDVTPDGKWLVVMRDRKGEENPGVYLLDPNGGPLRTVQHAPGIQTKYQFVSSDSKSIYFSANDRKADSYAIYRYDISSGNKELVFGEDGLWNVEDHQKDGKLLLAKSLGELVREFYEYDPASKKLTPLFGQGEREEYNARYGAAAGEIVVQTPKLGEFRAIYRFKDGKLNPAASDPKHDIEDFDLDEPRRHVFYTVNDGGYERLKVVDARTFAEIKMPDFPGAEHVAFGATSRDGRYTVIKVTTATSPTKTYVYDWNTKQLVQWVVPSSPEIDTTRFVSAKIETYPARDGTPIPVLVRKPEKCDPAPCPVIVLFHGGPEGQSRPGFDPGAQMLVDAGFVLLEPNVRGSDGYGKSWIHADDGPKRLDILTDIEDAAKYARKTFAANGQEPKVGVYGGSYGGYSTLVAMSMFAGSYDAGVAIVGISSLTSFLKNTAPYRRKLRASEYGDLEKDADALVKLSPITYIDKVKAPLLLIQGANDPRVPVGEAIQMHEALEKRGVKSPLIIFPDEGHGAQKRENKVLQIGHSIDFFEKNLKGKK
ncbi:MAG: prolyl oligopeptidase family serine peptidase [Polyangiaceae bacterium]